MSRKTIEDVHGSVSSRRKFLKSAALGASIPAGFAFGGRSVRATDQISTDDVSIQSHTSSPSAVRSDAVIGESSTYTRNNSTITYISSEYDHGRDKWLHHFDMEAFGFATLTPDLTRPKFAYIQEFGQHFKVDAPDNGSDVAVWHGGSAGWYDPKKIWDMLVDFDDNTDDWTISDMAGVLGGDPSADLLENMVDDDFADIESDVESAMTTYNIDVPNYYSAGQFAKDVALMGGGLLGVAAPDPYSTGLGLGLAGVKAMAIAKKSLSNDTSDYKFVEDVNVSDPSDSYIEYPTYPDYMRIDEDGPDNYPDSYTIGDPTFDTTPTRGHHAMFTLATPTTDDSWRTLWNLEVEQGFKVLSGAGEEIDVTINLDMNIESGPEGNEYQDEIMSENKNHLTNAYVQTSVGSDASFVDSDSESVIL